MLDCLRGIEVEFIVAALFFGAPGYISGYAVRGLLFLSGGNVEEKRIYLGGRARVYIMAGNEKRMLPSDMPVNTRKSALLQHYPRRSLVCV